MMTPFNKVQKHSELGMDTTALNYQSTPGTTTLAAQATQEYITYIPIYLFHNTLIPRDKVGQSVTIRVTFAPNVNNNNVVPSSSIYLMDTYIRMIGLELTNADYNGIMSQPVTDYRTIKKVIQSFNVSLQAGVQHSIQLTNIIGDVAFLVCFITNSQTSTPPVTYENAFQPFSMQLQDQFGVSLTNNIVYSQSQMKAISFDLWDHDFWSKQPNVLCYSWCPTPKDVLIYNKAMGAWKFPDGRNVLLITPTNTIANQTLFVIAFCYAMARSAAIAGDYQITELSATS